MSLLFFMDDDKTLDPAAPLPEEGSAPMPESPEEGAAPETEMPAAEDLPA
jgi:hypothetical protein